jgi:UDP-N-acetylglucosamine 1-carboxyvinyltransferase
VGATETLMMAAALADGETVIDNAAQEPEVVDLARPAAGHGRQGAWRRHPHHHASSGVERLHGADYAVIPDRIEAGTFLLAGAITRSRLRVFPALPEHLGAVLTKLEEAGCRIEARRHRA